MCLVSIVIVPVVIEKDRRVLFQRSRAGSRFLWSHLFLKFVLAEGSRGHLSSGQTAHTSVGLGGHKCALNTPLGEGRLEQGRRHGSKEAVGYEWPCSADLNRYTKRVDKWMIINGNWGQYTLRWRLKSSKLNSPGTNHLYYNKSGLSLDTGLDWRRSLQIR